MLIDFLVSFHESGQSLIELNSSVATNFTSSMFGGSSMSEDIFSLFRLAHFVVMVLVRIPRNRLFYAKSESKKEISESKKEIAESKMRSLWEKAKTHFMFLAFYRSRNLDSRQNEHEADGRVNRERIASCDFMIHSCLQRRFQLFSIWRSWNWPKINLL